MGMSWWTQHKKGQSIGKAMHFLYHYCGYDIANQCLFGSRKCFDDQTEFYATFLGTEFCTFFWIKIKDLDVPIFMFKNRNEETLFLWNMNQAMKQHIAIAELEEE